MSVALSLLNYTAHLSPRIYCFGKLVKIFNKQNVQRRSHYFFFQNCQNLSWQLSIFNFMNNNNKGMCGNYESLNSKALPSPNTVTKMFHTTFRGRCNHILHYPKISKNLFHVVGSVVFSLKSWIMSHMGVLRVAVFIKSVFSYPVMWNVIKTFAGTLRTHQIQ